MKPTKKAFTMIELVFVIVILGILASVAVSKMGATRDDALIAKARSQVASIRNAIALTKSVKMMEGSATLYPSKLDNIATNSATSGKLFDTDGTDTILEYPVYAKNENGHWTKQSVNGTKTVYRFNFQGNPADFTYDSSDGSFDCDHTNATCKLLTE